MMANIAPTPWVFDDESGCIRSLHGNAIAYLSRMECRENPGMEPLLTGAPELLAALKAVRILLHDELLRYIDDRATRSEADAVLEQIDVALAYVDRDTEPLSGAYVERWETLKAAARAVKEERSQ